MFRSEPGSGFDSSGEGTDLLIFVTHTHPLPVIPAGSFEILDPAQIPAHRAGQDRMPCW